MSDNQTDKALDESRKESPGDVGLTDTGLTDIETRISAARTRLIIEKPFLGALVLRLPAVQAGTWCRTTATDARKIYFNADYIRALDLDETQFVLAHEALHCGLSHFARRGNRDKRRWDIACDLAINPLLVSEGFKLPSGALLLDGFEGMTAEEIYPAIDEHFEDEPLDQHIYDAGEQTQSGTPPEPVPDQDAGRQREAGNEPGETSGSPQQHGTETRSPQPPPLTTPEEASLKIQWQQRLAGAAQQAMQAGKLGGQLARLVDYLLQPQLPWRSLLAHYMTAIARDDYTYTRPSSRRGEPAIYPSLRSGQVNVVVALDTSGSISDEEMRQFASEISAIKSQARARVVLHACDTQLAAAGPWPFEPWEPLELPTTLSGGGGTDFGPVFQWVDRQDTPPDLLVYFTDAEGAFPEHTPIYPVIWLVKGKASVPWGQRVQLN